MSKRKRSATVAAPEVRCATRALKNARHLRIAAPHVLPGPGSVEGFGTGIPVSILARLHHMAADDPELRSYKQLAEHLKSNRLPTPGSHARDPLFSGTIHLVQLTFTTNAGTFVLPDADMNTIVQYTQHAVVPISEYATQYGPNSVAVSPTFIRFTVNLPSGSYADSDVQTWVNDIVSANNLPSNCCIALVSPQGVSGGSVGGNSGYHGKASVVYTIFGVFSTGLTLQDLPDVYAMVVSHEIAELVVDPNVDNNNPEVCDPCDINCGPLHRCYFDVNNHYLGSTQALPPAYSFSYYICAVVKEAGASSCPAPGADCDYAPAVPKKIEFKEHKEVKVEKNEIKEYKAEKTEPWEHKQYKPEFDIKELVAELPWWVHPGDPIEQHLVQIEASLEKLTHFIGAEMRPDLGRGALGQEPDVKPRSRSTARRRTAARKPRSTGG